MFFKTSVQGGLRDRSLQWPLWGGGRGVGSKDYWGSHGFLGGQGGISRC